MNRRLRMNNHFHLARRHVKKSACLDDLKSLIHERGGIDGDPLSHLPGGMIQGLFHRDGSKLRGRSVAEGTTRSGKPYPRDFVHTPAAHALVYSVMFAV